MEAQPPPLRYRWWKRVPNIHCDTGDGREIQASTAIQVMKESSKHPLRYRWRKRVLCIHCDTGDGREFSKHPLRYRWWKRIPSIHYDTGDGWEINLNLLWYVWRMNKPLGFTAVQMLGLWSFPYTPRAPETWVHEVTDFFHTTTGVFTF